MVNTRRHATLVIGALAILVTSQPAKAAQGLKWWASEETKQELQLTDPQTAQLETIFQSHRPTFKELMKDLRLENKRLSEIMHAMQAEEWQVTLQIDKVESARSALIKTRTLMLYRMHKILSPEQLDGLHSFSERRRSNMRQRLLQR